MSVGRSRRTRMWVRWALRDARRRWVQVASISLLLALGVGLWSAMSSMSAWRTRSADASFAALRMHDLRVTLADGSYVRRGTLSDALRRVRGLAASNERLVVPTQVDAGKGVLVPGRIVGAPVGAQVDELWTAHGRALRQADSGRPVVMLERNFAKYHRLPSTGRLSVAGRARVAYVGQADGPEYFVVTAPGADFGAEANFAVLFAPLATAQRLVGQPGRVNELVLRVRPGADVASVQAAAGRALRSALPGTGFTFTRAGEEPARRLIYKDAEGDQQTMDVFAALVLGAAIFGVFNLVSRAVEAQRREIGIGMALGVAPRVLAIRPFLLGAQIALLGVALGIPAGLAFNSWLAGVLADFFPLPVVETPFQAQTFALGALLGLSLPLVATALPVRRALNVTPIEAIRVGARAARSNGLAWLARGIRIPGGALANLPLRNVLRTPRRTVTTALGIAGVVAIVIALGGMIDSFDSTLAATRAEALNGARDRLTVDLAAPQHAGSPLVRAITAAPAVGAAESSLRLPVRFANGRRHLNAFLEIVEPRGRLWRPSLRRGAMTDARPGVVIASRAAEDLRVGVGDSISVRHPVPTGPRSYQLETTRLVVTGIHRNPFRFVSYAPASTGSALRVPGLVNRLSVVPASGTDGLAVKRALLGLPAVSAVQGAAAVTDAVQRRMDQFTEVLVVSVLVSIAMALLIAFNSSSINADERAREHATMFAYGVRVGRVVRGNMAEALIIGTLATVIGIAVGYALLQWMVNATLAETLPDVGTTVALASGTVLAAVVAGVVGVALAPLLTKRRLERTDIPSALRVVE